MSFLSVFLARENETQKNQTYTMGSWPCLSKREWSDF